MDHTGTGLSNKEVIFLSSFSQLLHLIFGIQAYNADLEYWITKYASGAMIV